MSAPPRRYVALDSLRGLCACLVALFHLHSTGVITNLAVVRNGWIFVDFFFVLSGFVIAASYGERLRAGFPLREFMALRLGRIYPLHLFMLALFLVFELVGLALGGAGVMSRAPFTGAGEPWALLVSALLLQCFGLTGAVSWNVPSWSIAAEMWAYLAAAVAARLLGVRLAPALAVGVPLAALALAALPPHGLEHTYSWGLPRCLYGFALGWLTCERGPSAALSRGLAAVAEFAAIFGVVAAVSLLPAGPAQLAYPPLFAVVVWVFAAERGALSVWLGGAAFRRLGDWSYSIYMTHYFVLGRVLDVATLAGRGLGLTLTRVGAGEKLLAGPGLTPDALALVGLGCVVMVSSLTYAYVETPWRLASRRWARRIGGRPMRAEEALAPTM